MTDLHAPQRGVDPDTGHARERADGTLEPWPPPVPPEPVVLPPVTVGTMVPGLRQTIQLEYLAPHDLPVIASGDWPPPGVADAERARLAELREEAARALAAFRNFEREVREESKARALLPEAEVARRPRIDVAKVSAERAERAGRAEVAFLNAADELLGRLRERLAAELPELEAEAAVERARADELRREADAAEARAHEVESRARWWRGQVPRFAKGTRVGVMAWSHATATGRRGQILP
jgi:hypothetical protein